MKVKFSVLDRQYKMFQREYEEVILKVLRKGQYILGNEVEKFESEFARFAGTRYCVGVNSGLDALILAFRALGVGDTDEVIVPANTFIASVLGITENGAIPVFVEPDKFYNLDASLIEKSITQKIH